MKKKSPPIRHKIDLRPVTSDEALELMAHHLTLAAAYYEATDGNEDANEKEMCRIIHPEGYPIFSDPSLVAAKAFFQAIKKFYQEMDSSLEEQERAEKSKPN